MTYWDTVSGPPWPIYGDGPLSQECCRSPKKCPNREQTIILSLSLSLSRAVTRGFSLVLNIRTLWITWDTSVSRLVSQRTLPTPQPRDPRHTATV